MKIFSLLGWLEAENQEKLKWIEETKQSRRRKKIHKSIFYFRSVSRHLTLRLFSLLELKYSPLLSLHPIRSCFFFAILGPSTSVCFFAKEEPLSICVDRLKSISIDFVANLSPINLFLENCTIVANVRCSFIEKLTFSCQWVFCKIIFICCHPQSHTTTFYIL